MRKDELIDRISDQFLDDPPFPPMLFKILTAMKDKKKSLYKFGTEISKDPVLTAKILSVANSAQFSIKQKVSDLPFAVSLLGFDLISIIILKSLKTKNVKKISSVYNSKSLWLHSLKVAHLCRIFARDNIPPNFLEYYVAGLLHDIGQTAILNYASEGDLEKIGMLVTSDVALYMAENAVLGCNHAQVGFAILKKMKLSLTILKAVRSHHDKMKADFNDMSFILALSNQLSNYNRSGDNGDLEAHLNHQFGIGFDDIPDLEKTFEELKIDLEHL